MPSPHQILSLQAVFTMFWESQRVALPDQCVLKSPAALSRFFNEYGWPTRAVIRATRKQILKELLKAIKTITKKGQQVQITGFEKMVTASWFYLERNGKLEKRFVISTRILKGSTITWWGRRRWATLGVF